MATAGTYATAAEIARRPSGGLGLGTYGAAGGARGGRLARVAVVVSRMGGRDGLAVVPVGGHRVGPADRDFTMRWWQASRANEFGRRPRNAAASMPAMRQNGSAYS